MQKKGIYILVFIFTISTTDIHQFFALPKLVSHYKVHRAATPHMTIATFLAMHYSGEDIHDADYEQDQQLPFKTFQKSTKSTWLQYYISENQIIRDQNIYYYYAIIFPGIFHKIKSIAYTYWHPPDFS